MSALRATLAHAIDLLLSPFSKTVDHETALASLERVLAALALEPEGRISPSAPTQLDAFLALQDGFEYNITAALLEWLGRTVGDLKRGQSAILLPPSPAPSSASRSTSPSRPATLHSPQTSLALMSLDTLLCALVDRPRNMRAFESVGGLAAIVKVLKDKTVAQPVRIKAVEILYFYLLPEKEKSSHQRSCSQSSASTSSSSSYSTPADPFISNPDPTLLARAAFDFIPQTPVKPSRTTSTPSRHHRHSSSTSSTSSSASTHSHPYSLSEEILATIEEKTPRASVSRPIPNDSPSTPQPLSRTNRREPPPPFILVDPITSRRGPTPPPRSSASGGVFGGPSVSSSKPRSTRTTAEKREMLRIVMPNVEALEHRFEAMGLGGWEKS
ncbi:hypothetical protein P7C70_g254, partial [Phenoliferia sp. Uapishka_3]